MLSNDRLSEKFNHLSEVIGLDAKILHISAATMLESGISEDDVYRFISLISVFHCPQCDKQWYAASPLFPGSARLPTWRAYGGRGRQIDYSSIKSKLCAWDQHYSEYGGYCKPCMFKLVPSLAASLQCLTRREWTNFFKSVLKAIHNDAPLSEEAHSFWIGMASEMVTILPPNYKVGLKYYTKMMKQLNIA